VYSYIGYARLVIFSLAFEKTFRRGSEAYDKFFFTKVRALLHPVVSSISDDTPILLKSLESAMAVITIFVDSLVPTGYMRFAPECE